MLVRRGDLLVTVSRELTSAMLFAVVNAQQVAPEALENTSGWDLFVEQA